MQGDPDALIKDINGTWSDLESGASYAAGAEILPTCVAPYAKAPIGFVQGGTRAASRAWSRTASSKVSAVRDGRFIARTACDGDLEAVVDANGDIWAERRPDGALIRIGTAAGGAIGRGTALHPSSVLDERAGGALRHVGRTVRAGVPAGRGQSGGCDRRIARPEFRLGDPKQTARMAGVDANGNL
jgi:hypothetical protein